MPVQKSAAKSAARPATPVKRAASPTKPAARPAAKPALPVQAATPKPKLVRDSFTIPKPEYAVLEGLKQRGVGLARPVKKSELLRAGIKALQAMGDKAFLAALAGVPSLKTGRPKGVAVDPVPARKRR